jgi:hypothetical protein
MKLASPGVCHIRWAGAATFNAEWGLINAITHADENIARVRLASIARIESRKTW